MEMIKKSFSNRGRRGRLVTADELQAAELNDSCKSPRGIIRSLSGL